MTTLFLLRSIVEDTADTQTHTHTFPLLLHPVFGILFRYFFLHLLHRLLVEDLWWTLFATNLA